uniref:Alpha trans-inducing protein n=1 Tax=Anatid alphaherpesvirus 2 TaxID=3080522 RepID=A0AAU0K8H6_9ALPH
MDEFYGPCELFAEIEAYSAAMGDAYGDEEAAESVLDFDESLLPDVDGTQPTYNPACAPFARKAALPPPSPAPPSALYTRLLRELDFPEGPTVLTLLEKMNADLFTCLPLNEHLYNEAKLLSVSPEEVLDAAAEDAPFPSYPPIDLNAHCSLDLPVPPDDEGELPAYVDAVQRFFVAEVEARERAYLAIFLGYCRAIALYIQRQAARDARTLRGRANADETRRRAVKAVGARYYREAARIAKTLYTHLYLSVVRETSSRLRATQAPKQNVFVYMRYEWMQERQFWCLFHPVIFNHGVVMVEGRALAPKDLRALNFIRAELGLPAIRCGLVEEPGVPLTETPDFSATSPRSSGFLIQCIRTKMDRYSKLHPATPPTSAALDHPYAKNADAVNYGSTVEGLLTEYPDPDKVLPGDPVVPPVVSSGERGIVYPAPSSSPRTPPDSP